MLYSHISEEINMELPAMDSTIPGGLALASSEIFSNNSLHSSKVGLIISVMRPVDNLKNVHKN